MAAKTGESKRVAISAIESSLTALQGKLSGAVPIKQGSIRIRLTDSGDECSVDGTGREMRVSKSSITGTPLVEISAPSAVIEAIVSGKTEASRAFVAGGIQVRGDLNYLEALLKDLGMLKCGQ